MWARAWPPGCPFWPALICCLAACSVSVEAARGRSAPPPSADRPLPPATGPPGPADCGTLPAGRAARGRPQAASGDPAWAVPTRYPEGAVVRGTELTPAAGTPPQDETGAPDKPDWPPAAQAGPAGHRRIHRPRPRRPAVPAQPAGIPARRDPVRRRPLLRQRAAAGPRDPAVPRLHHRAAARHHPAHVAGSAARPGGRDGLGHGRGPDPHRGGQFGGRAAHRPAAAPPGTARGDPGVRDAGHFPGQPDRRAHGAAGAVAGTVLPGRRPRRAGRGPAGHRPAAGGGRAGLRVRRGGRGVGHPAGRRGAGDAAARMPGAPPGSWPG